MPASAAYLDAQFLTNTVTLSRGPAAGGDHEWRDGGHVRPASTAAQINADLAAMLAAITTDGAGSSWIMRPLTAYKIAATIGGTAAADIPRTLFGIPLVLSANSPQQITLVDAAHILYSDAGGIDVDTSDEALIQMNDAPDRSGGRRRR